MDKLNELKSRIHDIEMDMRESRTMPDISDKRMRRFVREFFEESYQHTAIFQRMNARIKELEGRVSQLEYEGRESSLTPGDAVTEGPFRNGKGQKRWHLAGYNRGVPYDPNGLSFDFSEEWTGSVDGVPW